ncbi:MAG TPA: FHA domain-containing protein, partial [Pyrinomonadaceae bacterium]
MKIVLAEDRGNELRGEHSFTAQVVKLGRDAAACQLVFDQEEWPMVSRQHAEIRWRDGRCLLVDTNSRFGTFLNGQRVGEPVEVNVDARVQLGAGGPVLRIVSIEQSPASGPESRPPDPGHLETRRDRSGVEDQPSAPEATPRHPVTPVARPPQRSPAPAGPAMLELLSAATGETRRIPLRQVTRLGRDPGLEVVLDAATAVVSRKHAVIQRAEGRFVVTDLGSFNGTLVNGQRITQSTALYDGDQIQLGMGGPVLLFVDPADPSPLKLAAAQRGAQLDQSPPVSGVSAPAFNQIAEMARRQTIVAGASSASLSSRKISPAAPQPQLLMQRSFAGKAQLSVGRANDNEIRLDGLQISNHHAQFVQQDGGLAIEDIGSTNGVYVNGERITAKRPIQKTDVIQIGPFVLQGDSQLGVAVFDTRAKTRIDAIDITKIVPNRSGGGKIKLLDDIDLTIQPNEFVGLLGPSGAGKSTLMDSLNGMRPATSGHVLINNLDLYQHLDSLKQSIGYVPQEDIIHRELTVYRTLYYVARLRLSRDVSTQEIDQIVNEVMDVTGLSERRDVPVAQLSGGQRKRVSIAVELITKPSMIFLDEPTSGLDPATEEKIMKLFRQIAESGRTVILTTHAMENVRLFDKLVVLMRGKLVFYGTPNEALTHVQATSFKDLYDKLEAPIEKQLAALLPLPAGATKTQSAAYKLRREQIAEEVAEQWKQSFQRTDAYRRNVVEPLSGLRRDVHEIAAVKRRPTVTDALRQWGTLTRRYMEVLSRDKFNLLILFAQAPIIALLTYLVVGAKSPRDFPYFLLALVAIWFGTSVAAREIIRERAVYTRERMVNLGLLPYVGSKLFVLSLIVGAQCVLLFGMLKFLHYTGLMSLPGWAIPQLLVVVLTGIVGIALGLCVSALVRTSEMATSLVPLILIPQILFSGLVGVPQGLAKVAGLAMPATWAFDELKRLSTLDTLHEEGSDAARENQGRGFYKHIEDVNDQHIAQARKDVGNYKQDAEANSKDFERKMK